MPTQSITHPCSACGTEVGGRSFHVHAKARPTCATRPKPCLLGTTRKARQMKFCLRTVRPSTLRYGPASDDTTVDTTESWGFDRPVIRTIRTEPRLHLGPPHDHTGKAWGIRYALSTSDSDLDNYPPATGNVDDISNVGDSSTWASFSQPAEVAHCPPTLFLS